MQPDTAEVSQARRARSVPKRLAAKRPDDRHNGHWLLLRQERNAAGDPSDSTLLTHPEDDCRSMSWLPKRPSQTRSKMSYRPSEALTATPLSSEFLAMLSSRSSAAGSAARTLVKSPSSSNKPSKLLGLVMTGSNNSMQRRAFDSRRLHSFDRASIAVTSPSCCGCMGRASRSPPAKRSL